MPKTYDRWIKSLKFQKIPGWCAPATISTVLSYAGIELSQSEIAKSVYLPWWGTTNDTTLAFLSQYFPKIGYQTNSTVTDLAKHLSLGHVIIVDWMDGFEATIKDPEDGHYSIIMDYDEKNKTITLVDPSNDREGVWTLPEKDFTDIWYDYVDARHNIKINGYMIWIDVTQIDYQPAYPESEDANDKN